MNKDLRPGVYAAMLDRLRNDIISLNHSTTLQGARQTYQKVRASITDFEHFVTSEQQNDRAHLDRLQKILSRNAYDNGNHNLTSQFQQSVKANVTPLTAELRMTRKEAESEQQHKISALRDEKQALRIAAKLDERALVTYHAAHMRSIRNIFTQQHGGAYGRAILYGAAGAAAGALIATTIALQSSAYGDHSTMSYQTRHTPTSQSIHEKYQPTQPGPIKIIPQLMQPQIQRKEGVPTRVLEELVSDRIQEGKFIGIDKDIQQAYLFEIRLAKVLPVSTGINPGERTQAEQGTTPTGHYEIRAVRHTKGVSSSKGVRDAYGPFSAIIDNENGDLAQIFKSTESKFWIHGEPRQQDKYLGNQRITDGCVHFKNDEILWMKQNGYFARGVDVVIVGGHEWPGTDEEKLARKNAIYASIVDQELKTYHVSENMANHINTQNTTHDVRRLSFGGRK